jgi:hypothetical protein
MVFSREVVMASRWSAEEIADLKEWAGKRPLFEIATKLGREKAAVATKAHELKISLRVKRSMDPGPAGMDLTR